MTPEETDEEFAAKVEAENSPTAKRIAKLERENDKLHAQNLKLTEGIANLPAAIRVELELRGL